MNSSHLLCEEQASAELFPWVVFGTEGKGKTLKLCEISLMLVLGVNAFICKIGTALKHVCMCIWVNPGELVYPKSIKPLLHEMPSCVFLSSHSVGKDLSAYPWSPVTTLRMY